MTVQQIMDIALINAHTKSNQVKSGDLLKWFNWVYKDMAKKIVKDVSENFFFQIWTLDAEDSDNADRANGEYLFPKASSSQAGLKKLLRLTIKGYDTDLNYKPCREEDPRAMDYDWNWYVENQPKEDPIYFIADTSIFIAPQWKADDLPDSPAGNKQIKAYGIASVTDLAANTIESLILIPEDQHERIAIGMEQYIYKSRGKMTEARNAKQEYTIEKEVMIDELTNRDASHMIATLPDDTRLQYAE